MKNPEPLGVVAYFCQMKNPYGVFRSPKSFIFKSVGGVSFGIGLFTAG
jgi:hypothetical protein